MVAYLDNAASTPVRPAAVEAMLPFLTTHAGNPSGVHAAARHARRALDDARDAVAAAVGARPGDVVFTSGGTEADNLAVLGVHDREGGVVVCGATEHHAVLDAALARDHRRCPVHPDGVVDLDALAAILDEEAARGRAVPLVSVMAVNNEVGTVQPLDAVAAVVREHAAGALLHTDAVQGAAWLDLRRLASVVDLISLSGHKVGAPKGIGALVVGPAAAGRMAARQLGGGQERGRRSGTQDVAGAVALGVAVSAAVDERPQAVARLGGLRDRLADGLTAAIPGAVETGARTAPDGGRDRSGLVAGTCHLCLPGVESEALLFLLDQDGVQASAASSCSSGAMEPSHVLAAMGVAPELAAGSLRLSLGWATTEAEVVHALAAVPAAVARLASYA